MGKADQRKVQNAITTETDRAGEQQRQGIGDTQNRVSTLMPRADDERASTWGNFSNLAATGGISDADRARLLGTASSPSTPSQGQPSGIGQGGNTSTGQISDGGSSGAPSSGGQGGAPSTSGGLTPGFDPRFGVGGTPDYLQKSDDYLHPKGVPDYVSTFKDMMGTTGGFDSTRLGNINAATGKLYDTSGNYGDVNSNIDKLSNAGKNYGATEKSVGGLQDFASRGGMGAGDFENINRGTLQEMEQTGGYSDADKANLRARGNSAIGATYGNLKNNLATQRLTANNIGPGWSEVGSKLARQGAQDIGTQAQNTEAGIADSVARNRLAASGKLGDLNLGLQGIKTDATLGGYTNAGNLDTNKNTSINNAVADAGKLGLTRQSQIDAAMEAAAGIDTGVQDVTNKSRLSAASGLSSDTIGKMDTASKDALGRMGLASSDNLGRMGIASSNEIGHAGIGASSAAANAQLDAANQRFLIEQGQQGKLAGTTGMLNTYQASPSELLANQNLLRGYRQDASQQNQGLINSRIGASYIPGIGTSIQSGLKTAGMVMNLAGGAVGGFGGG